MLVNQIWKHNNSNRNIINGLVKDGNNGDFELSIENRFCYGAEIIFSMGATKIYTHHLKKNFKFHGGQLPHTYLK